MNKREFFKTLGKAALGFAILPSAVTYARTWKPISTSNPIVVPNPIIVPNPQWISADYELLRLRQEGPFLYVIHERSKLPPENIVPCPHPPIRFRQENGVFRQVHPYMKYE